ncbi:hypothetical protein L6452_00778 [Arctium lappa]|uniref:Uncharacterized protein n=1 Tax=Arctium lappa TaxID=4217 RepID=A0ACB9FEZ5_ARCLA|nr:hypothetical protein L6452_00778 [Arctium lappa]
MEGFTRFLPLSESTDFRHTISQKRLYINRVREPISAIRFPSDFNISGIRAVRRFPSYEVITHDDLRKAGFVQSFFTLYNVGFDACAHLKYVQVVPEKQRDILSNTLNCGLESCMADALLF